MHILYKTTNTISGKFYIGVHTTEDLNDGYLGSGKQIRDAIKKYGKDVFVREILSTFESLDEAFQAEASIVDQDFINRKDTYNMTLGGGGSGPKELSGVYGKRWKLTEEQCHDRSERMTGSGNHQYGREYTQEERDKHSEIMRKASIKGKDHVRYGVSWSEEAKELRRKWSKDAYANRPNKECPHCGASMKPNLLARYHNDKCKTLEKNIE